MRATYKIKYFDEKKGCEQIGGFIRFIEIPEDIDRVLKIYDEFYKEQYGVTASVEVVSINVHEGSF